MRRVLSIFLFFLSSFAFGQNKPASFGAMIKELDILHEEGVYISEVVPNCSADAAGLIKGDILFSIGPYEIHRFSDIVEALSHFQTGDSTTIKFYRIMKPVEGEFIFYEKGKAPNGNPNKSFKKLYEDDADNKRTELDAKKKSLSTNNTKHTLQTNDFNRPTPVMTMFKALPDEYKVIGMFKVIDKWYEVIYLYENTYYMISLFEDKGTYGKPERLVGLGNNTWRFANDTGETFKLTGTALLGYANGDYASKWERIL